MIDEEFKNLVEQKSIGKKLNINNKEAIEELFVDEDISEYDSLFSNKIEKLE
ncbi:TPA: antitoxin [Streptococcus agalactiae]|nr:antitoxin [Streptococcus agalactiae]